MLDPNKLDEILAQKGFKPTTPSGGTADWYSQLDRNKVQPEKRTTMEKVAGFTGGEKLGQGLGQALANPGISKKLDEAQNRNMETQGELIKRIKEKKARGEDTSRLEVALKDLGVSIKEVGEGTGKLLNQKELTGKQVIGDALQLGTTVLGAGQLPGMAKTAVAQTGIIAGAKQGAIQGAKAGAVYGTSSGVSGALKEDKDIGDVLKSGAIGGLTGAGTGAILGGVIGGVSGGIKQRAINKLTKEQEFAEELVTPKMTTAVKEQALREGRVTEQGLLSASKIQPGKRDKELAEAVKGFVSSKKTQIQNIDSIQSGVDEINTGLKAYVKANKVPFNTAQLNKQLNNGKGELKLVFAGDKQAEKTYNAVVKEFMKHVKNKDTSGLFDARQGFDKVPAIKKLLDSQGLGENVKKEIVLTVRGQANKYVASLLPKDNKFRETLLRESKMIEAIGNLLEKNADMVGKNKWQALTLKYPVLKYWTSLAIGAGGVGVGSVIIGSSD